MSISLSDASLKTYKQLLPASLAIMKKAEKYFTDDNKVDVIHRNGEKATCDLNSVEKFI